MEKQITTKIIERQKLIYEQMEKIYHVRKKLKHVETLIREEMNMAQSIDDRTMFHQSGLISDELTLSELRYEKMKLKLKLHRLEQDLELVR